MQFERKILFKTIWCRIILRSIFEIKPRLKDIHLIYLTIFVEVNRYSLILKPNIDKYIE